MGNKFIDKTEESITKYFKEIRGNEILTSEEEVEIAKRIAEGDERALNRLVEANLKFVVSIAKEYQNQGIPLSDLINEGNYGLMIAARRFDYTKGFRFISYAVWWIKQSIMQSLNDNARTVRLPANIITKMATVKKQIEKFEKDFHRAPTDGEEIEIDGEVQEISNKSYPTCISLSHSINEDGDELIEMIEDDIFGPADTKVMENDTLRKELMNTLSVLDNREKEIIEFYFGMTSDEDMGPMTLEAIGEKYNLTKERIRQIKEKAIRKLRHNAHSLFEYMDN